MHPIDTSVRQAIWDALCAVGVDMTPADADRSLEDLDIDSLARAEIAARLQNRLGIDLGDALTPQATPSTLCQTATSLVLAG